MDYNALQHKLFAMDPADPAEDIRKMTQMANQPVQESAAITESVVQENVQVQEGTMPVEGDYSLNDFAKLAGIKLNEADDNLQTRFTKSFAKGYKNPNVLDPNEFVKGAVSGALGIGGKEKTDPNAKQTTAKKSVSAAPGDWQAFLKQHSAGLKAIANDPAKKRQFDAFMAKTAEGIEEGPKKPKMPTRRNPVASHAQKSGAGTHQDQHNKNKPDRKQKYKKDYANESIKTQLWAALNAK